MSDYILDMRNISMNFGGVQALKNVHLKVKKGEVHALMGENGAGKSTLMKILQGIYQPVEGEIYLRGEKTQFKSTQDALDAGISMIHQELNPIEKMTVAENMYLGREPMKRYLGLNLVDHKTMYQKAAEFYQSLDLDLPPRAMMSELSVARTQLAEIAKAVSYDADIVIMDEPTSALSDIEVEKLFKTIGILRKRQVTIIYISHKLDEIYQICDSVTVLRDGNFIGSGDLKEIDKQKLISMMVGREVTEIFPKLEAEIGEPLLEVRGLCAEDVNDVSFTLHKGEILGLAGLMGAGRTEVAEAIYGARPKTAGEILIEGKKVRIDSPEDAIKNHIAMVPEDRKNHGVVLKLSILDNIIMSRIDKCQTGILISKAKEQKNAQEKIEQVQIKTSDFRNPVNSLSGGNQQKVVVAKALFTDPNIIILDEPTRGIDVMTKSEIHLMISKLAQEGKGIIMISSEMAEVMGMSDRILVLKEGRVKGELAREEATQELILQYAF
ncbi:sugar ABC transporter ATP-binding protein [Enterocloster lavalensis]|uniref:sugar ABC transporter ATP-binding protein n=1 Tax=Enterocloster lavalensis TaxID=460384 RepID=UPI001F2272F8|nr:sugar ABC transporter ATP-binding protein [Enterocloster lavalensis]